MEHETAIPTEEVAAQYWEQITIEKFHNEERIKIMTFCVKSSQKSNMSQLVIDLLIKITDYKGYVSYFDSKAPDPFASKNLFEPPKEG